MTNFVNSSLSFFHSFITLPIRNTSGQFLPSLYSSLLLFLLSFSFREKYKLVALLLKQYIFLYPQLETSLGMPLIRLLQKMSFGNHINLLNTNTFFMFYKFQYLKESCSLILLVAFLGVG